MFRTKDTGSLSTGQLIARLEAAIAKAVSKGDYRLANDLQKTLDALQGMQEVK